MTEVQFVAEIGQANGDREYAIEAVRQFAGAGATHVKVQMLHPETIAAEDALSYWSTGPVVSQRRQFRENGVLTDDDVAAIRAECHRCAVGFVATPFDLDAVTRLFHLGPDAVKIASGDITFLPLVKAVATMGKTTFLSTGASTLSEIREAVEAFRLTQTFNDLRAELVPLACTLAYPTHLCDANIARIGYLRDRLPGCAGIGYSDHTRESITSMLAVQAGAWLLEKHVTLNPDGAGPDDKMALTPDGFRDYVRRGLEGAKIAGNQELVVEAELPARVGARRAARVTCAIPAGCEILPEHISYLRPDPFGDGMSIRIAGKRPVTLRPLQPGEVLAFDNVRCTDF